MSDTANLQIRVHSEQIATANNRLDALERKGGSAERATDGLTGAFTRLLGPLAGVVSVVGGLTKLVNVTREFDKLNAGLDTATGSAENAAIAFEVLQQFAADTPYDLAQVTDSFTKLVNYGLTPSERALTSYGDTASAMSKDLNMMIEAVADAATGEFERLKEFGIRASKEGDRVKFTFRGVATEVGFNAREIEEYLVKLGENNFAGAMAKRMDSLDGALSNLGDEWDTLFRNISSNGIGDIIEGAVRTAIAALGELNAMLASGEMEGYLRALAGKWRGWGDDITETMDILGGVFHDWADEGSDVLNFFFSAFLDFPENVRAMVQIAAVELALFLESVKADATLFVDAVAAIFNGDTIAAAQERHVARMRDLSEIREESIGEIMAERDASINSYNDQVAAARKLRAEYDAAQEAKSKVEGDRLAGFAQGADAPKGPSAADLKAAEKRKKEFEQLVESLRTEEEAIKESYDRRVAIVEANTKVGSDQRADLMRRVQADRDADLLALAEQKQKEHDSLYNGLLTEEEALARSYEERKKLILESTAVTEAERIDLMRRLNEQYANEQAAIEHERIKSQLSAAETLFDGLASLAAGYAGEQSKAYKALFAISKAFSIAQAVMSIQTGIAKAQELGFPANLGEMARVAATGAGILSQIQGSNFSGAYDKGGTIPGGKIGLVGEYGPELVEGPARVTSRADTAKMLQGGSAAPSAPPVVNIRNINVLDPSVVGDFLGTDEGEQMIMNVVQRNQRAIG